MPTCVLNYITPLECFKKYFPEYGIQSNLPLKIFKCTTYVHIFNKNQFKLDPRVEKCIFIGYALNKKGYKCFNLKTGKTVVSMNITFMENQHFFQKISLSGENKGEEGNFWDVISNPLLKTVYCITKPILQNEFFNEKEIGIPNVVLEIVIPRLFCQTLLRPRQGEKYYLLFSRNMIESFLLIQRGTIQGVRDLLSL